MGRNPAFLGSGEKWMVNRITKELAVAQDGRIIIIKKHEPFNRQLTKKAHVFQQHGFGIAIHQELKEWLT